MESNEKKSGTPDAGAASMAYMPGADGKTEAKEDEITINKSDEKKTMADIASELEAEDKAVKVNVGGTKPAKASKTESPAEPELDSPQPEHHEAPMQMPEPDQPRRGGKAVLIILLLLFLAAAAGLGWLYYTERATVADLNTQVADLTSSKQSLSDKLSKADSAVASASPEPAVSAIGVRLIPELGLTYKLTTTTKKVTYAYSEFTDSASQVHSEVLFDSTDLIAAERKVVSDASKYTCMAGDGPLGKFVSYKSSETVPSALGSGKFSDLKVNSTTTFKFGDTYYVFTPSQSTCSSDKTVQAAQAAGKALVTELLASLAVSK